MARKYNVSNRIGLKRGKYNKQPNLFGSCDTKQKLLNYFDNQTDYNKPSARARINRILSKQFITTNNNKFRRYIYSSPTSLKIPSADQLYQAFLHNYNKLREEIRAEIPYSDYCRIKDLRESGEIQRLENTLLNSINMSPRSDIIDGFNEVQRGALSTTSSHKTRSTYTSRENTKVKNYILDAMIELQQDVNGEYYDINT